MKKVSIRLKITLWFTVILAFIVLLTYVVILSVDNSVTQKGVKNGLKRIVESNINDIKAYDGTVNETDIAVSNRYLPEMNGIYMGLYDENGELVYGDMPFKEMPKQEFTDGKIQTFTADDALWYVYDREIAGEGLWLRGVVPAEADAFGRYVTAKQKMASIKAITKLNTLEIRPYDPDEESISGTAVVYNHGDINFSAEISDDFTENVCGVYTALYSSDGTYIYGDLPISEADGLNFIDKEVQRINVNNVIWYVYDYALEGESLSGLWVRGAVPSEYNADGSTSLTDKSIKLGLKSIVDKNLDDIGLSDEAKIRNMGNECVSYDETNEKFLRIDNDFLDEVNGIYTALYKSNGELLYGETPVKKAFELSFINGQVQKCNQKGVTWYVFDRELTDMGFEGLWLRGVVSSETESTQFSTIMRISLIALPALLVLAAIGGYYIAGRSLKPIKDITDTASHISKGSDLKKRINMGNGNDELHQLANAFDHMIDRLDTSFEAEKQFTADVSHELRTPMSVIMAQCELSLEHDETAEEYREALGVIHRQGKKMARLIDDMLTFSRMERKADSVRRIPMSLSETAISVCEDMQLLREKNITLTYDIDKNITVEGNKDLLARLLINLINNAYRYGRNDGSITVKLKDKGEKAILSVEDDGIGIAREEQEKIFRRFYQSDSARSNSGAGLGLAMAKEIAELHEGKITVESEEGEGSKFIFEIPQKGLY